MLINEYEYADVIDDGDLIIRGNQMIFHYELIIRNAELKKLYAEVVGEEAPVNFIFLFVENISNQFSGKDVEELIKICDSKDIKYEHEAELV